MKIPSHVAFSRGDLVAMANAAGTLTYQTSYEAYGSHLKWRHNVALGKLATVSSIHASGH